MLNALPPYIVYLLAFVVSAAVSAYAVKKVIFITRKRRIFDIPDNIRKIHGEEIPSLGGIGVFVGFVATSALFAPQLWNYLFISCTILFFTGIYDDVANMRPSKKLLAQLVASLITVYFAHIRIESLFMGTSQWPVWLSVPVTTIAATFFVNVFNFIDGIDGLACLSAMLYSLTLAFLFVLPGLQGFTTDLSAAAFVCLCLAGATAGLLLFNYAPAKIYMGDTGSMMLGFVVFIFSVHYLNYSGTVTIPGFHAFSQSQAAAFIVVAMLFPPVFDALRVFTLRLLKGQSPLHADRRHLHYYLLDAGFSHAQAAWTLVGVNLLTMATAFLLRDAPPLIIFAAIILPSAVLALVAARFRKNNA